MPISWSPEPDLHCVVVTFSDPYTFQEWDAALSEMMAARACEPWRSFLIDRRESTPPTTEFIRSMARAFSTHASQIGQARAAVVVSNEVGFGMGRMAQMTVEAHNPAVRIRTFREYDDARRWLMPADAGSR